MMTDYPMKTEVENYCRSILILFYPFRKWTDLVISGSYHKRFLQVFPQGRLPIEAYKILSNVQLYYDSLRLPARDDPISSCTTPFRGPGEDCCEKDESDIEDDESDFTDLFGLLSTPSHADDNSSSFLKLSLLPLRKQGARGCGFQNLPSLTISNPLIPHCHHERSNVSNLPSSSFISTIAMQPRVTPSLSVASADASIRDKPLVSELMYLTYDCTRRNLLNSSPAAVTVEATGTVLSILEWSQQTSINLDVEQQLAFQIATAAFVLTYYEDAAMDYNLTLKPNGGFTRGQIRHDFTSEKHKLQKLARLKSNEPLRMFLDGGGGSGKSRVVNEILKYAQDYTSRLKLTFNMRTIVVTAMSGVAATCIGGETLHSAACFSRNANKEAKLWANARLLIIDEISFMSTTEAGTLDAKLRELLRCPNSLFGGMNILFCGDFRQLEPVAGKPLYTPHHGDKTWLHSINSYVELLGSHRFQDDPEWGRILSRIRNGISDQSDIDAINAGLVNSADSSRQVPRDASYCVYRNSDRTAINAGVFSQLLKEHWLTSTTSPEHMVVIMAAKMTKVQKKKGCKLPLSAEDRRYVYEHCGDNKVTVRGMSKQSKGHFVDPLLKLYYHAPLMLVSNDDVPNGHANGTRVLLETVVLKSNTQLSTVSIDNLECPAIHADLVDHIICCLEGNPSKKFYISPKTLTCSVDAPIPTQFGALNKSTVRLSIEMTQIPIIVNNATTGHKLQGQTKHNLVIVVWCNKKNWNYVALSRVTTRAGLFLVHPLPYTTDFSISNDLTNMLVTLKAKMPSHHSWNLPLERSILLQRLSHLTNVAVLPHSKRLKL
jgi:hypothetical protein